MTFEATQHKLRAFALRHRLTNWHEPDEQDIGAYVTGTKLDNAMGDTQIEVPGVVDDELRVILTYEGAPEVSFSLATILALAAGYWEPPGPASPYHPRHNQETCHIPNTPVKPEVVFIGEPSETNPQYWEDVLETAFTKSDSEILVDDGLFSVAEVTWADANRIYTTTLEPGSLLEKTNAVYLAEHEDAAVVVLLIDGCLEAVGPPVASELWVYLVEQVAHDLQTLPRLSATALKAGNFTETIYVAARLLRLSCDQENMAEVLLRALTTYAQTRSLAWEKRVER